MNIDNSYCTLTRVLVVEDNPLDARMVCDAIEEVRNWPTEKTVADDGEKAIHLLLRTCKPPESGPDLVILDLSLPKRDGTEVLRVIRTTDYLRNLPVVILSSSPTDVIRNKISQAKLEATCYITKPMQLEEFLALGPRFRCCYEKALSASPIKG